MTSRSARRWPARARPSTQATRPGAARGASTVAAKNATTSCAPTMSGNATAAVNSAPTGFNVTGGSSCTGGTGVTVGLDGSQTGVLYQVSLDGNPFSTKVAGTGAAL